MIAFHRCGRCQRRVTSALHASTGLRLHVERSTDGRLSLTEALIPGELPLVDKSLFRTGWREHVCYEPPIVRPVLNVRDLVRDP